MPRENKGETGLKIMGLESVRGLAAFAVVLYHFTGYYQIMNQASPLAFSVATIFMPNSPLFALINGAFSVTVFFVLSGFVLSYGFFTHGSDLVSATLKRYFRLMPVAFVSVISAYFLLKLGLFMNAQAGMMVPTWQNHNINLLQAIWEGLAGVFIAINVDHTETMLNPVLWTIYYELLGSVIIYSILALTGKDSRRIYIYVLGALIFLNTYFVGFIIGMILADIYTNRADIMGRISGLPFLYKILAGLLAMYLAGFPPYSSADKLGHLFQPLLFLGGGNYALNCSILYLIASCIVIILALTSKRLKRFLELKPLVYLGSISYSLYATHYIVLGSFVSIIFLWLRGSLSVNKSIAIAFLAYIFVAIIAAHFMHRYVDVPSIKLSKRIGVRIGRHHH